ncbi:Prefoldin subunit-domain-containing protein [Apiosordaria backusii]|uniref:Prefoldin subunit 4 n=1 Tax=Apiosordaria backusii TaxID=314023 RepID=A0AA40F038_9PEZI|nr:Prefoldin subunit-domain-containing protein [Apiosordaria backusii]
MNLSRRMLTKEEEDAVGDEIEVRREDQDKINKFSRLHSYELSIEEQLKAKNKEKEELDDITTELELADEDDLVPYKIGDAFFHLPLPHAQELLGLSTAKIEQEIGELEDKMATIREEMTQLKVELYARFGKTINLET